MNELQLDQQPESQLDKRPLRQVALGLGALASVVVFDRLTGINVAAHAEAFLRDLSS